MADPVENVNIKENFVEDGIKVDVEATTVNLDCVKSEPNEGTLDFEEDNHSTQYKITLKYEDIYGESSRQIKIEEDYDNLIGFLDNDVIMENAMIKLEAIKEEDDGSFNDFHCRNCKGIYKSYCLKCSTLLCILNKNTSIASLEAESNTIPTDILEIRATSQGKGVYLLRTLPINIIFGPFEGILGIESTIGHSWKTIDNKLRNIKTGNWMKNIVCAASALLKNLDIFQIDGNLYFQTNREVTEGEELLIYYDDVELQQLDNSKECLYTPQKREKLPKIFACTLCCLGFGSNKCLMEHKRKCCRIEHSRSMDEFVLIECNYCKMWMEKWEHEEYHVVYCLEKHHRTWSGYSEAVDPNDANVEEMREGDCGTRAGKRRYRGGEICSRRKDRRDDLKFNTEDYQCLSGGNQEIRLNECGALLERSNNEQTQNNTIGTNNSHHLHKNLNKHTSSIRPFKCDICMMKFTLKESLKMHIRIKHTDDGNVKDYKCSHCSFRTNYKTSFQNHVNKHKGIKPFQCGICMKKFTERGGFRKHLQRHSGGIKPFTCDICMKKFTEKGTLRKHLQRHSGIKPFTCDICMKKFTEKGTLRKHLQRHSGIKPFTCDICMKKFTLKGNLKVHIRNKHTDDGGVKDYKCSECSYATNHKSHLQTHLNKHKGIKPFQCEICMKTFTEKGGFRKHLQRHSGIKPFRCGICMKKFTEKGTLRKHLQRHSGIKPFTCDICMMKFTEKANLKRHIQNKHTDDGGVKDYKCLECSYRANNKSYLQKHLNTHKGIKPFQCDFCMMKFTDNGGLKKHIRNKHTDDGGVKDYKCLDCTYATNYKTSFQRHINKHKGIKPFQCDICMKTFTLKVILKNHIKNKHADDGGVKDYKCAECTYATNYKHNLQQHLNKHKGIKPFTCDICLKGFTLKGNLSQHIKRKHINVGKD